MMNVPMSFLASAGAWVLVASTQQPVAIVEEVVGRSAGVEFMDYVVSGQVIPLGPGAIIVLGYLTSCWHETITGGTVTVGNEQSEVSGGKITRTKVECDGGKMMLNAELGSKSGGMVLRASPHPGQAAATPPPQFTLYGLSPMIEIGNADKVVIERVDVPGERHEVVVSGPALAHGAFLDLAKTDIVLVAGGTYRVKAGPRKVVFKVDPDAKSGATPIVGRLLRLPPAS
jgi:hypothetical protein